MNLGFTLGRKGTEWTVVTAPQDATLRDQMRAFYGLTNSSGIREKFDELQIWSMSGGRIKRRVLGTDDGKRVRSVEQLVQQDEQRTVDKIEESTSTTDAVSAPVGNKKKSTKKVGVKKLTPEETAPAGVQTPEDILS